MLSNGEDMKRFTEHIIILVTARLSDDDDCDDDDDDDDDDDGDDANIYSDWFILITSSLDIRPPSNVRADVAQGQGQTAPEVRSQTLPTGRQAGELSGS